MWCWHGMQSRAGHDVNRNYVVRINSSSMLNKYRWNKGLPSENGMGLWCRRIMCLMNSWWEQFVERYTPYFLSWNKRESLMGCSRRVKGWWSWPYVWSNGLLARTGLFMLQTSLRGMLSHTRIRWNLCILWSGIWFSETLAVSLLVLVIIKLALSFTEHKKERRNGTPLTYCLALKRFQKSSDEIGSF